MARKRYQAEETIIHATGTDGGGMPDEARSACAARTRPGVASDGTDWQDGDRRGTVDLAPCDGAQPPYNAEVDVVCRPATSHDTNGKTNEYKSLKHGPLAQLASAPR